MNNYSLIKKNNRCSSKNNYKILIVNLKKRCDRKENIINSFKSVNFIESYSFYDAIDGNEIKENLEMFELFKINDFASRKGFIGCALSHYNIWINLLKDSLNDYYVIFEDDIELCENFPEYFNNCSDIMKNFLEKIDILFLGYHDSIKFDKNSDKNIMIELNPFNRNDYIGGTFGYIITKKGAKKMIKYIENNGIKHGIDYLIKINKELSIFELNPHIIYSNWVKDFNSNIDSDIQKDFVGFNLNNAFQKYYNENAEKNIKVKMLCNWQSGDKLCEEWNPMSKGDLSYTWNNIQICGESCENPDYYIIVNMPRSRTDFYDPSKTIVFQMEPMCLGENQTWGVKTWGEWANPDKSRFLEVRNHANTYNNCTWQLKRTYKEFQSDLDDGKSIFKYYNYFSTICSSKYLDPGHRLRVDFLKYCENENHNSEKNNLFNLKIDIYGFDNKQNFKNYKNSLDNNKEDGLMPYKYYFIAENNSEKNYISEKLWEPILCECLCFYWGAPNVADYIHPDAFVQLDLNDFEGSYKILKNAIIEDWHSKRINIIRKEKNKILNYYNFFPTIERIILKDIYKTRLKEINESISIHVLSNNLTYHIEPFLNTLINIGFVIKPFNKLAKNIKIKIEDIDGSVNQKRMILKDDIKYFISPDEGIKNDNVNILLRNYEQIHLFEEIILKENDNESNSGNHLIIIDKYKNTCYLDTFLKYIDPNNLPPEFDVCQLTNSIKEPFKLIEQTNLYYFRPKKYFFNNCGVYIVSKKGIEKILRFLNNYVPYNEDFMYDCYENIEGLELYVGLINNDNNSNNTLFI
jgi:GR25 family glycosyltransferase involved in LPS biosynthesis